MPSVTVLSFESSGDRTLAQTSAPGLTDEAFSVWWKRGVEAPWIGDALERVFASVFELKAGAGHEIADRARDQNLSWDGFSGDAGADVDSKSRGLAVV